MCTALVHQKLTYIEKFMPLLCEKSRGEMEVDEMFEWNPYHVTTPVNIGPTQAIYIKPSLTLMHQALLVPEVLLEIFAYVNTIPSTTWQKTERFGYVNTIPPTQITSTLAALARTCKIFHEPVMDLLWIEIHGLEPLLGCVARLHPLIYRRGTRWDDIFSWAEGVEPLSAHEARQFLRHFSRIRTLNIERTHLQLISVIPANVYVFPRLRSLSLSIAYLNHFLPLTLHPRHLLNIDKSRQSFVTRCSALEHLYIHTDGYYDIASQLSLLSDRIRRCTRLVTLSCPMLNWETWKHLSCLPTLLKLEIDQGYDDTPSLSKRDIVNLSFLNITSLSFRGLADAAEIITVIQHSQFPSLKKFKLAALYLYPEEAEQLFHALSCCKACQTLEEITICSPDEEHGPSDSEPLTPVPHLLCFTQLRTLQLWFYNPCIYLDNGILLQAMFSWPHIRTLEINYLDDLDDHHASSEVSLHGLFTALSLCPQLHTLQILINLATIDVDPHAEPIQHTSLQTLELLDISQSQIADAEALARVISAWLPCVDKVNSIGSTWDEVNKHLKSSTAATALYVAETS
ncbi:uncharacterized protein F5147DRAFT_656650 [Suillus discolor]|uniref:F-box domain-containing protein n=1 Tax=Suillus discolor TaxID=1912936 RepID=A0A9P7EZA1_9AGAM|nr:uncharacterized protein F5147DRAFT_656650 [Suillus discolor]KAG2096344.1 hypothetical protein F5147DRAFT_656650 [Suillus discolor]